jgi:hypothetical protein
MRGMYQTAFNARYVPGRDAFQWNSILPVMGFHAPRDQSAARVGRDNAWRSAQVRE